MGHGYRLAPWRSVAAPERGLLRNIQPRQSDAGYLHSGSHGPPVAGAGIIKLVVVLQAAGLPVEGIALIIGVDRIINMSRVVPNVVGDTLACVVIADSEGELGKIVTD